VLKREILWVKDSPVTRKVASVVNPLDELRTLFPTWRHGALGYTLQANGIDELEIGGHALCHDGFQATVTIAIHQRALRRNVRILDPTGVKVFETPNRKGLTAPELLRELETLDMQSMLRGYAEKARRRMEAV
jgi:hypothetical protein